MEPKFYAALLKGLGLTAEDLPRGPREDRSTWPTLRTLFAATFRERTRKHWEDVFDGSDACVTPVLSMREGGYGGERPAVGLVDTPGLAVEGSGGLERGEGAEVVLREWCGWKRGRDYEVDELAGSWVKLERGRL